MKLNFDFKNLDQKKLTKILSIAVGSLLALVLLFFGFRLVQGLFSKASSVAPSSVVISAITQKAAHIAWVTDQETQGVIEYGSSPTALNYFAPEAQKGKTHAVDLDLSMFSPGTTFYFQVRIGDQKYDNSGVPWTFATKSKGVASDIATGALSPTPAATIIPTPVVPSTPVVRPTSVLVYTSTPTPVPLPTLAAYVCGETNCVNICGKIGKTCSSQDWMRSGCVGKVTLSTCTQVVPTNTPAPTAVLTSTPTPTPTTTLTPTPTVTTTPTPTNTPTPTPHP